MNLDSYTCELCGLGIEETTNHLFLQCLHAQHCWGLINLTTSLDQGTLENFAAFKDHINSQFFMVAIILMCSTIWLARNERIFLEGEVKPIYLV
jgi:tryptophanyl-tRNA synthetase